MIIFSHSDYKSYMNYSMNEKQKGDGVIFIN